MIKPSIPKGTRDFSPEVTVKRNYIFDTVRTVFQRYGFQPIETPAFEKRETLTGKYGEEGDKLIFSILRSGAFEDKFSPETWADLGEIADKKAEAEGAPPPKGIVQVSGGIRSNSAELNDRIRKEAADKALRYDLTVPFARYVVQHQNEIAFPFKRYQIQPVWRADRPQKGRYQEFYQCDVDVIGTDSLLCEVELVQIMIDIFSKLGLAVSIKINNRKILQGIADKLGVPEKMMSITIALDKLDKVGEEGVTKELKELVGLSDDQIKLLRPLFSGNGGKKEIKTFLGGVEAGAKGLEEVEFLLGKCKTLGLDLSILEFDPLLARGLNYYTGTIFEVVAQDAQMGSICGGGRYDDLTGIFGLNDVSGVGISFGADRIYDVMEELNLFPDLKDATTQLLFVNFGETEADYCLLALRAIRAAGINAELYPSAAKMKKQMKYANDKKIAFVAIVGSDEIAGNKIKLKNMESGEEVLLSQGELIERIRG